MAPPCGTSSRARGKPLPKRKGKGKAPRPLRSEQFPWGLEDRDQHELMKVVRANYLYLLCSHIALWASLRGIPWVIENPANSLLWYTGLMKFLLALPMCLDIDYDACMHGGNRPKKQRFRSTLRGLQPLAVRCDQQHWHAPWGLVRTAQGSHFATAEEAEYTQLLCDRYAKLVIQETSHTQVSILLKAPLKLRMCST